MLRIILLKPIRRMLQWLKSLITSNKTIRALLYDIENLEEFTDLYEHEKMLADSIRINMYHAAIQRYIKPEDVVIDLGAGTGIFSIFAAQQNPKRVYAIDHSHFISVAERIVNENHVKNITFLKINSRSFVPDEQVDVILHEQIGDDLFDENMVENILDLKKRLLKKTGRVLPGRFELYLEPVSLKSGHKIPCIWETKIHGIDFRFLKDSAEISRYKRENYNLRFIPPSAFDYFLCEASAILAFDLNEINDQAEIPKTIGASRIVRRSGSLDGFCLYFRVVFDDEISFDTSPFSPSTHWGNHLFRLESKHYREGENISYTLNMKDIINAESWSVRMNGVKGRRIRGRRN